MRTGQRGPAGIRAQNRQVVIEALLRGPQSRTELADIVGLSRMTVSGIVDELLEGGFVSASEQGRSKVISLNTTEENLVLDLTEGCRASIMTASGEMQCEADPLEFDDVTDPEVTDAILELTSGITAECASQLTRVVLVVRGVVDENDEWMLSNDHRSVRELPSRLRTQLGLPVSAVPAHRAALMATLDPTAKSQMTIFSQNSEMGLGLALDGFPFGDHPLVGDISHLYLRETKESCPICRRNGCLKQAWMEAWVPSNPELSMRNGVGIMNAVVAPLLLAYRPELVVVSSTRVEDGNFELIERLLSETLDRQVWHLQSGPTPPRFIIDGTPLHDLLRIGGAAYARWLWAHDVEV